MRPTDAPEGDSTKRESAAPSDQQKKKRKIDPVATAKKPVAQLEKWAAKRQELEVENRQLSEFADLSQMCCLLCKRKFQSVEEIEKHEKKSKLHEAWGELLTVTYWLVQFSRRRYPKRMFREVEKDEESRPS